MTQATYPTDADIFEQPDGSRALKDALELRAAARRARRKREILYFMIVAIAGLSALAYGALIAPKRYSAEARFSVRASSEGSSAAPSAAGIISTGAGQGSAIGFVDGFAVNDFLKSRDCMRQLAKRIDLRRLLARDDSPFAPLSSFPSEDRLYRAYRDAVRINFNMLEQVNVIEVSGFSPGASQQIGDGLLALAQEFVARMDEQGVADSLDVARRQLRAAEQQDIAAANALAQWRADNQNIDPQAESAMVMQKIGQIEQELTAARINYEKVAALGNPEHPMLEPARRQVSALERQLAQARGRLAGSGNSEAARLKTYEQLKNQQTFADNNLAAARNAYQQAFLQTMRLRRYLTVIARPVAGDRPSSPKIGLLGLEGLLGGFLIAFAASIALDIKRRR